MLVHYPWFVVRHLPQNCTHVTYTNLLLRWFITKGNQIHSQLSLKVVMSATNLLHHCHLSCSFLTPALCAAWGEPSSSFSPSAAHKVSRITWLRPHWSQNKNSKARYQQEDAFMNSVLPDQATLSVTEHKGQEGYNSYQTCSAVLQCTQFTRNAFSSNANTFIITVYRSCFL